MALEGKRVEVLIEMPATSEGIDLEISKMLPLNYDKYSNRLKRFGISLYPGDRVLITKIKKKSKHIEFQLAGGGYGTSGDDSGNVHARRIPKSSREKDLEKEVKDMAEGRKKDDMEKELDDLRRDRRIEQDKVDRDAEIASNINQDRIQSLRLQAGSRFNIRFDRKVEDADLTPENIMDLLGEYISFNPGSSSTVPESKVNSMAKGISWDETTTLLGAPKSMNRSNECGLDIMTCTFEKDGLTYEVTFVEEVVVKFNISSG